MKNFIILFVFSLLITACKPHKKEKLNEESSSLAYHSFGDLISEADFISS